jgi:hypothetical protein
MNVKNEDESPITVRDFFVPTHAHLSAYRYDLPRNMSKPSRRTGRLVFKWAGRTTSDDGVVTVKIWTFVEGQKEEFWERRRVATTKYREMHNVTYERERQDTEVNNARSTQSALIWCLPPLTS